MNWKCLCFEIFKRFKFLSSLIAYLWAFNACSNWISFRWRSNRVSFRCICRRHSISWIVVAVKAHIQAGFGNPNNSITNWVHHFKPDYDDDDLLSTDNINFLNADPISRFIIHCNENIFALLWLSPSMWNVKTVCSHFSFWIPEQMAEYNDEHAIVAIDWSLKLELRLMELGIRIEKKKKRNRE